MSEVLDGVKDFVFWSDHGLTLVECLVCLRGYVVLALIKVRFKPIFFCNFPNLIVDIFVIYIIF